MGWGAGTNSLARRISVRMRMGVRGHVRVCACPSTGFLFFVAVLRAVYFPGWFPLFRWLFVSPFVCTCGRVSNIDTRPE